MSTSVQRDKHLDQIDRYYCYSCQKELNPCHDDLITLKCCKILFHESCFNKLGKNCPNPDCKSLVDKVKYYEVREKRNKEIDDRFEDAVFEDCGKTGNVLGLAVLIMTMTLVIFH